MNRRSLPLYLVLAAIAAAMLAYNLAGARHLLRSAGDPARIPLVRVLALAADIEADDFGTSLRVDLAELVERARLGNAGLVLTLPDRDEAVLGVIDTLTRYERGATVRGWAVSEAEDAEIAFVGATLGNRIVTVLEPNVARPDVEAHIERDLPYEAGFELWIKLPEGSRACGLGIFAITSEMTIDWLRPSESGCLEGPR